MQVHKKYSMQLQQFEGRRTRNVGGNLSFSLSSLQEIRRKFKDKVVEHNQFSKKSHIKPKDTIRNCQHRPNYLILMRDVLLMKNTNFLCKRKDNFSKHMQLQFHQIRMHKGETKFLTQYKQVGRGGCNGTICQFCFFKKRKFLEFQRFYLQIREFKIVK